MPMQTRYMLLIPLLTASLVGCKGSEPNTAGGPTGGPSSSSPSGPYTGTPASTDTATRTPGQVGDDVVLTGKVKNALITSKVDARSLNVDTANDVVTLKGSVPTAAQKSLAEKVAKQVAGVKSVKNELAVGAKK